MREINEPFFSFQSLLLLCSIGISFFCSGAAWAHKTNIAQSLVTVNGSQLEYKLTVSGHDLAAVFEFPEDLIILLAQSDEQKAGLDAELDLKKKQLEIYLTQRIRILTQGESCPSEPLLTDFSQFPNDVVLVLNFQCPVLIEELEISYLLFFDIDPTHRSFGKLVTPSTTEEFIFDRTLTQLWMEIDQPKLDRWEQFSRILLLGIEHIWLGFDHLLFLFALIVVNVRFYYLLKVITAFTLAHSLTLAIAWWGWLELPSRLVESLIALSIVYVALENLMEKGVHHRWMVSFGFGLVHGLGFYGVLNEMEWTGDHLVSNLLGFNLGVELGQIAAVLVVLPFIYWGTHWFASTRKITSFAILAIASFWFFERAFFL